MSQNSYVYGPRYDNFDTAKSIGVYLFECLQKKDIDEVLYEDAISKDTLTCGQLLEQSIKLVDILKGLSISNGDVICVISENNINYFTALLACFFMGAVPYPLNPAYKEGELTFIFQSVKVKLLICSEIVLTTVKKVNQDFNISLILLNKSSTFCDVPSIEELIANTCVNVSSFTPITIDDREQKALILCSSGTTGTVKGVMLSHQNLIWLALTSRYIMCALNPKSTIHLVPSFHVYGTIVQFSAIVVQMKVIVMNGFKPEMFFKIVEEENMSAIFVVPSVVDFMAKSHLIDEYKISCLKNVVSAASQLSQDLINHLRQRLECVTVLHCYGLTEVSGAITFQTPNQCKIGSVGLLLPGAVAKIRCLRTRNMLDPTQVGEVCITGPMLMKGYLNNDAATKGCLDEENFLYTGDIGYFDKDNYLHIVDRLKDIIKYKGFQVSPSELENLILKHTSIKDCAVIGIPNERAGELPLAFIVPNDGANITEQEIVDFVAERISEQKHLRGGVRFISSIPRTGTGKVQRLKLRELYQR